MKRKANLFNPQSISGSKHELAASEYFQVHRARRTIGNYTEAHLNEEDVKVLTHVPRRTSR